MKTRTLGEIKLYNPEQTISLLWTFRDKRVKFELGSDRQRWPMDIYNCIQFAKVIEGLRTHYGELSKRYFFKTVTKMLYGLKTFSISYDQKTCTMTIKTGYTLDSFHSTEYSGVCDFSYTFANDIDNMIYQMQRGLPSGLAESLLQECKNLANDIPVKSSFLKDLY